MDKIIDLHHDIFFFVILLILFVIYIMFTQIELFKDSNVRFYEGNTLPSNIVHNRPLETV
jgi:heme/copper-type cytochrome/quinol oxidase subunit 2